MSTLRTWLNQHPLGAPYRGLRDLIRLSANRRAILEQHEHLRQALAAQGGYIQLLENSSAALIERLNRLERLEHQNVQEIRQLEPLYKQPSLPFSHTQPAPNWVANAEKLLNQPLATLPAEQRDHWFYSFYSEMAGGVGHILEQQYQVYLPRLPRIEGARVLDIGCGAGEFLNFLRANDVPALGIDLDAHEVERACQRGLSAVHAEATEYLKISGEKFAAICLFQVIEHVPPELVRPLIETCASALAPGGVLLIETINLRNPNAVNGFYTDPTHQVPLSDNYLSFVFQWNQLENVEFIYTLPEWLSGISAQDLPRCYANYTVIGYKPKTDPLLLP